MKPGLSLDASPDHCQTQKQAGLSNDRSLDVPQSQVARRLIHAVRGRPGPGDRPPLPAGHPETWDCINEGTCIAGAPYPFPVFLS